MKVFTTHQLLRMSTSNAVAFANSCSKGAVRERVGIYPGADNSEPMDISSKLTRKENIHVYLLLEQHGMNLNGTYNDKNCAALGHCWGKSKTAVKLVHEKVRCNNENSQEIALLLQSFPQTGYRARAMAVFLMLAVVLVGLATVFAGFGGISIPKEPVLRSHAFILQNTMTQHLTAWAKWLRTTNQSEEERICREAANVLLKREEQLAFQENAVEMREQKLTAAEIETAAREKEVLLREEKADRLEKEVDGFHDKAKNWTSDTAATVDNGIKTLALLLVQMQNLKDAMRSLEQSTRNAGFLLASSSSGDADHGNDQLEDH